MKTILKTALVAATAMAAAAPLAIAPAAAQVSGNIATVNAPGVIITTNAFRTGYQQIGTTYATQTQQLQALQQEGQTLLTQLDTNGDGQLDQAEQQAAQNSQQATRLQQIEQQSGQLSNQIDLARVYVVEQLMARYGQALQQVVTQNNIQMVVSPDAVVYAPEQANVTTQVTAALNGLAPSVQITPPQGWQPQRNSVAMFQRIQQALVTAQAIQQAQQGQAQAAPAPAQQQPTGR